MSYARRPRRILKRCWTLMLLACLAASGASAAPPTVDGLFYGPDVNGEIDATKYSPYATSANGSVLYSYLDASTSTLYVALVVSHSVNDMVCSPQSDSAYTQSAGWPNHRNCKRASDSEYATFTLECAPGSANAWTWQQALGCAKTTGPPPSAWVSDSTCGPSSLASAWPPGVEASSTTSWVQNVNTYQTATTARAWDLYALAPSGQLDNWKSPFLSTAPSDVLQVPGHPTYSDCLDDEVPQDGCDSGDARFDWEWSMVYEWSVDLGTGGAGCGSQAIFFIAGTSHHSPGKAGPEDDPFTPPDDPFSDWGDLPEGLEGGVNRSYGTTDANGGPLHYIKVTGPYLGTVLQAETDGAPSGDATGDGPEEDGVSPIVDEVWHADTTQSFSVTVSNAPTGGAVLGGWFDWNNDGDFDDEGEFVTWSGLSSMTHTLDVSIPLSSGFNGETDELYARFRIFSSEAAAPGGTLDVTDAGGTATDGEVEDYYYAPGTLPVTLNAFSSEGTPGGDMTVRWQTASETDNVAFEVWGLVNGTWEVLSDLVETRGGSSALPQSYEVRLSAPAGLTRVQLVDYDSRGRLERFGPYRLGQRYGEVQPVRRIDWSGPRAERSQRLREQGFAETSRGRGHGLAERAGGDAADTARWKKVLQGGPVKGTATSHHGASALTIETRRGAAGSPFPHQHVEIETGSLTHVAVSEPGIQRVTYEALLEGGLDLADVPAAHIAVTWRGEPVARWIDGPGTFGPGSAIEFLGRPPAGDDALYIDANLYQVSVDRTRARDAANVGQGKAKSLSSAYLAESWKDLPATYYHQSPTGDPWIERAVLTRAGRTSTVTLDVPVSGPVAEGAGQLVVGLGAATDLPTLRDSGGQPIPEHNVEVWFRGPGSDFAFLTSASTSGQTDWTLRAALPEGLVEPGVNQVQLRFSTDYLFSYVVVDRYGIRYPSPYHGPALDFAPDPWADGYRIESFGSPSVVAYAETSGGALTRVDPKVAPSGSGYAVELRQVDAERYWVTEAPHSPTVFTTEAPADLLAGPADLVVIAGSSFVGTRALEDYAAQKAAFDPVVIDVEDVYNAVGFGMALPSAITDYLAARDAVHPFTHVQLVGADCYDRLNYISQCISFLPLPTSRVGLTTFTPSQNRLVDLDGDGVGDKAVAQFSVRDETELATVVAKGAAWETSGLSNGGSALFIAEESDGTHDFAAQVERVGNRLGWKDTDSLHLADHPSILTARSAMSSSLDAGRAVTVFSGHSSPTVWAFRSLLTTASAAGLTNVGRPTIMVPLACETTYDISPTANVLGHQLLFSGGQGALAISGAVALSNLHDNERMANQILGGLEDGLTLGEAVLAGRAALGRSFQELQDNWITQGDVTVRLRR